MIQDHTHYSLNKDRRPRTDFRIVQDNAPTQHLLTPKSKMEDAPRLFKKSKVRVSTCISMDTSSTTQVSQVMVKHREHRGSSRTKSVRSPACWPLAEKTFSRGSMGSWMGKSNELEVSVCLFIGNKDCSCRKTWMTFENGWKQSQFKSHVEETDEAGRSWRANIIS